MTQQLISDEAKRQRQENLDFSLSSVRLEGFQPSQAFIEHMQRYVNGEITFEQLQDYEVK